MNKRLTLMDIVVLGMIAVVMGVVSIGLDTVYMPLEVAFGPYGGALIYGFYMISAILPMYIIQKPGAALVGSLFTGLINILLGSPYGIHIVVACLAQGLGTELGELIFGYKRFDLLSLSIGAILGMLIKTARDYFVFGFGELGPIMPYITIVRLLSAVVAGAFVSVLIGNALVKTGVLNQFEIAKNQDK